MVKITAEHREASFGRAQGLAYAELADRLGCTPDRARQLVQEFCRVMSLQLNAEQPDPEGGGGVDGSSDGG